MKKKKKRKLRRNRMLICIFLIVFAVFAAGSALFVLMPYIRFTDNTPVLERMDEYHASDFVS